MSATMQQSEEETKDSKLMQSKIKAPTSTKPAPKEQKPAKPVKEPKESKESKESKGFKLISTGEFEDQILQAFNARSELGDVNDKFSVIKDTEARKMGV